MVNPHIEYILLFTEKRTYSALSVWIMDCWKNNIPLRIHRHERGEENVHKCIVTNT